MPPHPNIHGLLLVLVLHCAVRSDSYDFDASSFDKKPYSASGSIELRPSVAVTNRESEAYKVKYGIDGEPRFLDNHLSRLELSGDYRAGPFFAFASGLGYVNYERYDDLLDYDLLPYEAYGRLDLEYQSTSLWLGKKTFKWGKGYAYNPTAFAARPKDINDIDANLEGYWSLSGEFIRSFSGPISTMALNAAIIPEYANWNEGYLGRDGVAAVAQLYLLAYDTDLDFCFFSDFDRYARVGAGFSRNIVENLEVHGESAWLSNHETTKITPQISLESTSQPVFNALLGIRYLTPGNTTVIAEYVRNGEGLSLEEMDAYHFALRVRQTLPADSRDFLTLNAKQYQKQFAMRDYLYVKASHPEPFGILYFTPSAYAMINLGDASLMMAIEGAFTRIKNTSLIGRIMVLQGGPRSEYGSKIKEVQFEFRGRYYF